MNKFIPITTLDSKRWTTEQAKRVWRINAAAIAYFVSHTDSFDYNTQEGQDCFFAICAYFLTHPLIDEDAPGPPSSAERLRRQAELEAFTKNKCL
ncbi:MAG TPA: hypothetical protein VN778_03620 [Verrucomicrobiae bacterium]|nr:hypothetical protein [Verrucomicrobiae bacterium]